MIIVEGPDGAGKTTLIDRLRDEFGLEVAPRVVSKDAEAMVDLQRWTEENVGRGFRPEIFDRHRLISEPIYGPLLRSTPEPGFDDRVWLINMMYNLYELEPLVIYCLPPFEVCWENVKDDPDNKVVAEPRNYKLLWHAYLNKAVTDIAHRPMNTFLYDYTLGEEVLTSLLRRVTERLKQYALS